MTPFRIRERVKRALGLGEVAAPARPASSVVVEAAPAPVVVEAPASPAVAEASAPADEEKQRKHWERTRKGMLKWLSQQAGGSASMKDMHDHSEKKFFVAHRGFSRLMEEFTEEGLVDYSGPSGVVTLTEAGRGAVGGP